MISRLNQFVWNFRSQFSAIPEYDFDQQGEVVHNFTPIKWTKQGIVMLWISGAIGAIFGIIIAMAVNTALVEISVSSAFSLYFGALFVFVGLIIVWRIVASSRIPHPDDSIAAQTPRRHLIIFACLNVLTGILCFVLESDSLLTMSLLPRLLVYSLFGMSTAFALTFGAVDLLNLAVGVCRPESARPLVESVLQIYVVVTTAVGMGALFGCLFGFVDINNQDILVSLSSLSGHTDSSNHVKLTHLIDPLLCIPIGMICGGLAGVANEYIRRVEISFNKLDQPIEFEYDI